MTDYGLDVWGMATAARGKRFICSLERPHRLWNTQSSIQWIPGGFFPGLKPTGRQAVNWTDTVPKLRMSGPIPPFPHTPSEQHRKNVTF